MEIDSIIPAGVRMDHPDPSSKTAAVPRNSDPTDGQNGARDEGSPEAEAPKIVVTVPTDFSPDRAASPLSSPLLLLKTPPPISSRSSSSCHDGGGGAPLMWDKGINWSRSKSAGSSRLRQLSCSSSSDEETSGASSVDLEEEHQASMAMQAATTLTTATTSNMEQAPLFVPLPYPRRRGSSLEASFVPTVVSAEGNIRTTSRTIMEGGDDSEEHPNFDRNSSSMSSGPPLLRASSAAARHTRDLTARSRRSLLFLFLIAVYTTFGLTSPNLPVAEELDFQDTAAPNAQVLAQVDTPSTAVPQEILSSSDPSNKNNNSQLRGGAAAMQQQQRKAVGSNLSFARRNSQTLLTFRKKEMTDFYHQQALRDESSINWSWYVNCTALAAIALWAWRERSIATALEVSQQRAPLSLN